jgi:hypothetical protein
MMLEHFNTALRHNDILKQSKDIQKNPEYINTESWLNCINLEKMDSKSNPFADLTKSLVENSLKWIEYLQFDQNSNVTSELLEREIDLLNRTPLDSDISSFEKLILWLCLRPLNVRNCIL